MSEQGPKSSMWRFVTVVLVVVLVLISVATAISISNLQAQVSSLENMQSAQEVNMIGLENAIGALNGKVDALTSELASQIPGVVSISVTSACVSLLNTCEEDGVYSITVVNNGTVAIPAGPVYLRVNDTTRRTSFGFNASETPQIGVGEGVVIVADSWPPASEADAILSPGDNVVIQIWLGSIPGSSSAVVMTCAITTTTQTFNNYTVSTFSATQTLTSCD